MRVLLLALVLASCTPTVQGTGCPRLTPWSGEDQKALAAAYREGSPIVRRAIDDLQYMRDQARACQGQ